MSKGVKEKNLIKLLGKKFNKSKEDIWHNL